MATKQQVASSLTIEAVADNEIVSLTLTAAEVESARALFARSGCTKLYVMKRDEKSGAMFYIDENAAIAALYRHNFKMYMAIEASQLTAVNTISE